MAFDKAVFLPVPHKQRRDHGRTGHVQLEEFPKLKLDAMGFF